MTVHRFVPDHWFTTIGSHDPVLTIADGDTVITTTVDARGADATGQQVTERGNPMTGPFFVTGAEPGDTLAVTFDRLRPNRATGWTRRVVAPWVVDAAVVRDLPALAEAEEIVQWAIDHETSTATLINTAGAASQRPWSVPLRPMLGCFGTAPDGGQAISTATSGRYGGNMDYNGHVAGTTNYLPVNVSGALFHLGDGHAVQGDGEIVGTGVEISFDVQFSVRVIKGQPIGWPRGENEEFIFTVGCARPLDQCLQHATTEMLAWLKADYGLEAVDASTLLGQAVAYDLGNIFDPAYTMVCKVPKRFLPR